MEKEQAIREAEINKEKTIHLNKVILGYIDVCINSGYVNEANAKIKAFYDLKPKMMKSRIFIGDEAQVFNPLLQKYASNGDFKSVLLMLSILRKNNLPLASQMYSHIFYCIGRMNNTVNKLGKSIFFSVLACFLIIFTLKIVHRFVEKYSGRDVKG